MNKTLLGISAYLFVAVVVLMAALIR